MKYPFVFYKKGNGNIRWSVDLQVVPNKTNKIPEQGVWWGFWADSKEEAIKFYENYGHFSFYCRACISKVIKADYEIKLEELL